MTPAKSRFCSSEWPTRLPPAISPRSSSCPFPSLSLISRARDFLARLSIELPQEIQIAGWNAKLVVQTLRRFDPSLSFSEVFKRMDSDLLHLDSAESFLFLNEASLEALGAPLCNLLKYRWKVPRADWTVL